MQSHPCSEPQRLAQLLWLQVTLSGRLDAAAVEQWRRRLHDHLSAHGLVAAISPARMVLLSVGRVISPVDCPS